MPAVVSRLQLRGRFVTTPQPTGSKFKYCTSSYMTGPVRLDEFMCLVVVVLFVSSSDDSSASTLYKFTL